MLLPESENIEEVQSLSKKLYIYIYIYVIVDLS